ncbi:hypothetical protein [Flavitalea sp.]|nr:hypothetical protein [Flavitalea sp.]
MKYFNKTQVAGQTLLVNDKPMGTPFEFEQVYDASIEKVWYFLFTNLVALRLPGSYHVVLYALRSNFSDSRAIKTAACHYKFVG